MTDTTTPPADPTTGEGILYVDPRDLAAHPANTRRAVGDTAGLEASIRELGILQPIIVVPLDDGWQVLAGTRRLAAALKLELEVVPIRPVHLNGSPEALAVLGENLQRLDLTAAEEADAYLQLQLAGLDATAIADATGVDAARVDRGLKVAASATAAAVAQEHPLTLDQAVVIAEFDGDKDAVKQLTAAAVKQPGQFVHLASRLRQERDLDAEEEALTAKLQSQGVAMIGKKVELPYRPEKGRPFRLDELAGPTSTKEKRKAITPTQHKSCPGHAARIRRHFDGVKVQYVCTDPIKHGHKPLYDHMGGGGSTSSKDLTDAQRKRKADERRTVIENNKAWKAATPVRREFVAALAKRKTPPKGTLRYVTLELVGNPRLCCDAVQRHLDEFFGTKAGGKEGAGYQWGYARAVPVVDKTTDPALPLMLFAHVAAALEAYLETHTWRSKEMAAGRYLAFLEQAGYELADVEQVARDTALKGRG